MSGSVSQWIAQLKGGEADAARELWLRYSPQLIELSRRRLSGFRTGLLDEEDIAQSVFRCICRGAQNGQFEEVRSRDEFWWLLITLTMRKTASQYHQQTTLKRGGGKVKEESSLSDRSESGDFGLDQFAGSDITPDVTVIMEDERMRLLGKLEDVQLRRVAVSRIEGYTVEEIAGQLSLSTRSIERKLNLIRDLWRPELCDVL